MANEIAAKMKNSSLACREMSLSFNLDEIDLIVQSTRRKEHCMKSIMKLATPQKANVVDGVLSNTKKYTSEKVKKATRLFIASPSVSRSAERRSAQIKLVKGKYYQSAIARQEPRSRNVIEPDKYRFD